MAATLADYLAVTMATSISMAGQKEVTLADWMVKTTATKMDGRMVQTMAV